MPKFFAPLAARLLMASLTLLLFASSTMAGEGATAPVPSLFKESRRFGPTEGQILQAEVSCEGTLVAIVTSDGTGNRVAVYEIDSGKVLYTEKAESIYDLAWGADRLLYVLARGEAGIAVSRVAPDDATPRAVPFVAVAALLNLSVDGYEMAVSADGKRIAVHEHVAPAGSNKERLGLLGVWDLAAILRDVPSNVPGK